MNIHRTSGRSVTQSVTELRRLKREADALAIVKSMRPVESEPELPTPAIVPYVPRRPDPTYTFWGHPNDQPLPQSIVYFMYSGGRIKIGFSTGLRGRHNGLKKAGPFPPVVLLIMEGGEEVERPLHQRFAEDRLHGEWFNLSPKLRNFLRGRLCDRGLASFEDAELAFRDYCAAAVASYKEPPKRKPRPVCEHGLILHHPCPDCERDRDLKILEGLKR
jgi:hypothetical protein